MSSIRSSAGRSEVRIRAARSDADLAAVRTLFEAYRASLDVDLCFQGFAAEIADPAGVYRPPAGDLWLAGVGGRAIGCCALRPLPGGAEPAVAEFKRLYVCPQARGLGAARLLLARALEHARAQAYQAVVLDTLPQMVGARALYEAVGFETVDAYYHTPLAGTTFMRLVLA